MIRNALNLHNVNAFYQLMAIGVVVLLAVEADVIRGVGRDPRAARARDEGRMTPCSQSAVRRSASARSSALDGVDVEVPQARCSRCSATTAQASRR